MDQDIFREVDFHTYCKTCKHKYKKDYEDPCNDCLEVGMREETVVPEHYERAEESELKRRSREDADD